MQTVIVDDIPPLARVTLHRPEVRNAFDAQMVSDLTEAFGALAGRADVRCVVLQGDGPSFSAGADVNWMRQSLEFSREENVADARRMSDMFGTMNDLPQPLVGRVHGAALGGGMGLIAVCDVVVAEEGTVFGFTEARLGIIPAVISRFVLPKIGESWARALFLSAERFGNDLAQQIGLVHWIASSEELDSVVRSKVDEIMMSGPEAVRHAKRLIASGVAMDRADLRDFTAERIAERRASPEGQEGLRAFLEKRSPAWRDQAP